ncbi:magnesium transporter CorA family protein [Streptomyces hirsutus]
MADTRLYRAGSLVEEDFPVRDISRHLADPSSTVWLDLYRPNHAEFTAVGEELVSTNWLSRRVARGTAGENRQLPHPLLPQCLRGSRRPGRRGTDYEPARGHPHAAGADHGPQGRRVRPRRAGRPVGPYSGLAAHGVAFAPRPARLCRSRALCRGTATRRTYRGTDDLLFAEGGRQIQTVQRQSYALRKSLVRLRRVVLPMREVVNTLMRPDLDIVDGSLLPYYRDVCTTTCCVPTSGRSRCATWWPR